jgi:FkbM family methyltransferase
MSTPSTWAKTLVKRALNALPGHARQSIMDYLIEQSGTYQVMRDLARRHHVESLKARGEYGLIEGDIRDSEIFRSYTTRGVWTPELDRELASVFADGGAGCLIDVGANIGLSTIPVARNPLVTCHCFEPEPRNFAHLTFNVAENCPSGNVVLHNVALFDRAAELEFELSSNNMGDHRVRVLPTSKGAYAEDVRETIRVRAARLDDVLPLESIQLPIAVKIDTQGAEPQVVAGAPAILQKTTLLHMEFWPYGMRRAGGSIKDMLGFLCAHFEQAKLTFADMGGNASWVPAAQIGRELEQLERKAGDTDFWNVTFRKNS